MYGGGDNVKTTGNADRRRHRRLDQPRPMAQNALVAIVPVMMVMVRRIAAIIAAVGGENRPRMLPLATLVARSLVVFQQPVDSR